MKRFPSRWLWVFTVLLTAAWPGHADWLTFGHDAQRTGWAAEEKKLTPASVSNMKLRWSLHLDNASLALNALTAPLVARDVVTAAGTKTVAYVAGSSNHLFAVDVSSGKLVWQRTLQSFVTPKAASFYLCPNALNATPVIDRKQNMIFVLAYDGRLFGLDLGTGAIKYGPFQFVPPFAKAWSLNLHNGFIYTTTSQGCGGDRSGIYSIEVDNSNHRASYEALIRNGGGGGMWSRGGTVIGEDGKLYVPVGDGNFHPMTGDFGSTYLAATTPALTIVDYFSPMNWDEINGKDLDLPSGGHLWFAYRNYHLLVGGGKESVVYLMNADDLGSKDHQTPLAVSPQIGNLSKVLEEKGLWGAPAMWKDAQGQPWIYVTLWGEPAKVATESAQGNGAAAHGSVIAFRVELDRAGAPCLKLAWISPDINLPDAPAVANGMVFVVATGENPRQDKMLGKTDFKSEQEWKENLLTTEERGQGTHVAELMVLDARTGQLLYRSKDAMKSWNHFGGLAIDDGMVFVVDHGSTLYCFGLE